MGGEAAGEGRIGEGKEWGPRVGLRAQDLSGVHARSQCHRGEGKSEDGGELDFSGLLKKR